MSFYRILKETIFTNAILKINNIIMLILRIKWISIPNHFNNSSFSITA